MSDEMAGSKLDKKYIIMSLDDLIAEHKKLIKILESGDDEKIKEEAEEQAEELESYIARRKGKKVEEKESNNHITLQGITIKEGGIRRTLVATSHPDRENDIFSKEALQQMVDAINDDSRTGSQNGAFRLISYAHDWVRNDDPSMPPIAFFVPGSANLVALKDGHFGVEADFELNKAYKAPSAKHPSIEEADYLIEKGEIAGMSVEFYPGTKQQVKVKDQVYNVIKNISQFCGAALARARMIANPHAIIYKEIEEAPLMETYINKEMPKGSEQMPEVPVESVEVAPKAEETLVEAIESTDVAAEAVVESSPVSLEPASSEVAVPSVSPEPAPAESSPEATFITEAIAETIPEPLAATEVAHKEIKLDVEQPAQPSLKEVASSKEFKEEVLANINIKSKVRITDREDSMEGITVKELNAAIKAGSASYKEVAEEYLAANQQAYADRLKSVGVLPMNMTMQIKCAGTKLRIASGMEVKDTLNTTTNVSTYTQNIAEFADVFQPGIVDTFNNQTNLFGALDKLPNLEGSQKYGWTIKADRATSLDINPDIVTVNSAPVSLIKLQTDMKEYRVGVIVTDFVLHHSRQGLGDLMQAELNARMNDLMWNINTDLFTGQTDTGTKVVGLLGVADSTTYTTMYGLTRSVANRLKTAALATTYVSASGAGTQAALRLGIDNIQTEGTRFQDLLIVMGPAARSYLMTIMGARQYIGNAQPEFGFSREGNGSISGGNFFYDGIPCLVDPACLAGSMFVIDRSVAKVVISRAPQMIGLAKIGAAEGAYISTYMGLVYLQPRRIFAYVGLTSFSA